MVNEQSSAATPVAGYHVPKSLLTLARPLMAADIPSLVHEARTARRMLFLPDVSNDPRFEPLLFEGEGIRSMLLSPVSSKDRLFGGLVLIWCAAVQEVGDGDLALMAAISAQAGLVLENAQLLEATQSQAAALREKNTELDSFVYTVSHDLKAPLVAISGMSGLVLDEHAAGLDDEGRHYLQRVVANTRQMERLIGDLLALSRIGREARAPEEVPLTAVVGEILDELAEPLRARGIAVVVGALPSVRAVRVQMEQVIRNLMTNAVKYMGDAPSPTIELGSTDRGSELEVWVRDTGIGIAPEYHAKIFEVFQRLKEVEAEGTGVGLAIVKKIVEAAGGRIWLESARGQGSTFHFTWPAGY
jgi:signal transduction histidine kinase